MLQRNARRARLAAHRLNGSSRYVGATRVTELSSAIEHAAREGRLAEATALEPLEHELMRLQDLLRSTA